MAGSLCISSNNHATLRPGLHARRRCDLPLDLPRLDRGVCASQPGYQKCNNNCGGICNVGSPSSRRRRISTPVRCSEGTIPDNQLTFIFSKLTTAGLRRMGDRWKFLLGWWLQFFAPARIQGIDLNLGQIAGRPSWERGALLLAHWALERSRLAGHCCRSSAGSQRVVARLTPRLLALFSGAASCQHTN